MAENPEVDLVNKPPHYISETGLECIEISSVLPFNLGNAFKYIFRFRRKGTPRQDLEKAKYYLRDYTSKSRGKRLALRRKISGEQTVLAIKYLKQQGKLDKLKEYGSYLRKEGRPEHRIFLRFYMALDDIYQSNRGYIPEFNRVIDEIDAIIEDEGLQ